MSSPGALPFQIVDVFTDTPYAGNPLAVVFDGDELSTAAMQTIAREFNLSETVFPVATTAAADYQLRIFTPSRELPFAGHPSIGGAWSMRDSGRLPATVTRIVQECGAGLLPLEFDGELIALTGGAMSVGEMLDPGPLLASVALDSSAFDGSLAAPRTCGAGLEFTYLPVTAAALAHCDQDLKAIATFGGGGLSVFHWDPASKTASTRVFAAGAGVPEDPATGSAALGFGAWLAASGQLSEGVTGYVVSQGVEMGRPSTLHCTVTVVGGVAVSGTVAGGVRPVASGQLTPPSV